MYSTVKLFSMIKTTNDYHLNNIYRTFKTFLIYKQAEYNNENNTKVT